MVEASADVTLPVSPEKAYDVVSDVGGADWLPAVRGVRHVGGTPGTEGARYEVEAGLLGRHLAGVLVVTEASRPERFVLVLEEGLDLTITVEITGVDGGCELWLEASYSVGRGPLAAAAERASQGAARREVARALEQLAARFGRKGRTAGAR